jgi:hypothetical protein
LAGARLQRSAADPIASAGHCRIDQCHQEGGEQQAQQDAGGQRGVGIDGTERQHYDQNDFVIQVKRVGQIAQPPVGFTTPG